MEFEWDNTKAVANQLKHAISFEEAMGVFADPNVMVLNVSRSRDNEVRYKTVGLIARNLFVVVFTERGTKARIISSRRANRNEERIYGNR